MFRKWYMYKHEVKRLIKTKPHSSWMKEEQTMRKKKALALVMSAIMLMGAFTGCGSKATDTNKTVRLNDGFMIVSPICEKSKE